MRAPGGALAVTGAVGDGAAASTLLEFWGFRGGGGGCAIAVASLSGGFRGGHGVRDVDGLFGDGVAGGFAV